MNKTTKRVAVLASGLVLAAGTFAAVGAGTAQAGCSYGGKHYENSTSSYNWKDTMEIQCRLQNLGYSKVSKDGDFGPITKTYVQARQKRCRLAQDGIVGPMTWKALKWCDPADPN